MEGDRGLERTSRNWERLATTDAMWAVLTSDDKRGNWDVEEFLESGREHITWLLAYLDELGIAVRRRNALDFGCGVGRLTGGLAEFFDHVDGVDVSPSMVEQARALHEDRASFHVNTRSDLMLFPDGRYDLVVTYLVLQHLPTPLALSYIGEFVRLLAPGGVAVFQAPTALTSPKGKFDSRLLGPRLRNLAARAKGAVLRRPVMEMHMLDPDEVRTVVVGAGGELVHVTEDWTGGDYARSILYVAGRPEPAAGEASPAPGDA